MRAAHSVCSLPPCGGGLGRGVRIDPRKNPPSRLLRTAFAIIGLPHKGGGNEEVGAL